MSKGDFLESLSRAMLVGTMLVGRLGVAMSRRERDEDASEEGARSCICTPNIYRDFNTNSQAIISSTNFNVRHTDN